MAEAFISSFGSAVGKELFGVLHQKLVQYSSIHEEIEQLKILHEQIENSLTKADALQARDKDENRHDWILQMREVVVEVEVIIDSFNLEENLREERSFIKRHALFFKRWAHLCKLSKKIQLIKPKIEGFETQKEKYLQGNAISSPDHTRHVRRVLHNTKEDFVMVGLEKTKATLIGELLKEDPQRRVISIVGMPGIGKTTLAKHVYIRDEIKRHFDCCSWADVSKDYNVKNVLLKLRKNVGVDLSNEEEQRMEEEDLMGKLNNFLENKRYLVVLDDLWSQEAWDDFQKAFPNGKLGSKVMLTSRYDRVATYADPQSQRIVPELLSKEESWALFCQRALYDDPANCPEDLKDCGELMVQKCGGLPLAIMVLGGLLSTKNRLVNEWEKVLRNINWNLGKEERLKSIIALSYDELSYRLKSCLLYMSLFPEDYHIKTRRLIGLWMAEGFVCKEGEETLHDAAEDHLEELISRGMVQVAEMSSLGRVKSCRLHDVLRDFSIVKAKDDGFGEIFNDATNSDVSSTKKYCKLAFYISENLKDSIMLSQLFASKSKCVVTYDKHPRSLLMFYDRCIRDLGKSTFNKLKLLRVLDLEGLVGLCGFPKEIGNLIHLRYLGMRNICLTSPIPRSVGNLRMLQTLDLYVDRYHTQKDIPNVLWKMEELRILCLPFAYNRDLRIDNLRNLETLKGVNVGSWMKNPSTFTNMVKLYIRAFSREDVSEISTFVDGVTSLQSLLILLKTVHYMERFTILPLRFGNNCRRLVKLKLKIGILSNVHLRALPNPDEFPPNLTTLKLDYILLEEDPMPTLEKLPNLINLHLYRSYNGKSMICKARGFPRLQNLYLFHFEELEEWIVEEGALPCLQHVTINQSDKLMKIPEGLRFITSLRKLSISHMPDSTVQNIISKEGED